MNQNQQEIAIVTGASSGIGQAVARLLSNDGVAVGLFDVNLDSAQEIADELSSQGGNAISYKVDVGDENSVVTAVEAVRAELGTPSMLCNSAAIQHYGRTESTSFEKWRQLINVNLNGTYFMCKAVLPSLLETSGSLVNIASLAGKIGLPYDAAYSASKGGVIALTKALAKEYADRDVRINVIAPGAVDTPMYAMATPEDINPKVLGVIPRSARPAAEPDEIASLVRYLLKDAPAPMTGSVVSIDGASN